MRCLSLLALLCAAPALSSACGSNNGEEQGANSEPEPTEEPSPEPESSQQTDAKALFGLMCAPCHGEDFRGGPGGIDLTRRFPTIDDEHAKDSISNGVPPGMPAWSESLTEEEIQALVEYLRKELD